MNLLAIDTTTDVCSTAVHRENQWFEHTRFAPRLHNRHVLTMVDGVLESASLGTEEIDLIAFGAGPGSFTGVRIGAAVSQGIAMAADAKLVRVPSSAVAAETLRRTASRRGEIDIARTSRPGWHYRARYRLHDAGISCIDFDRLFATAAATPPDDAVDGDQLAISARIVGALALERRDAAVEAAFAQPYYVEGDSPWQPVGTPR